MYKLLNQWYKLSLVKRIIAGLIIGIILGVTIPDAAQPITIFGALFVGALKAIAPMLVFFLVASAISQHKKGQETNMKSVIVLYLLGTFLAALVAVVASFIFPVTLTLGAGVEDIAAPGGRGGSPEGVALERRGQSSQGSLQCQLYRHLVMGSYARLHSEECRSFNQADAV